MLRLQLNESPYPVPRAIVDEALSYENLALHRYPVSDLPELRELYAAYSNAGAGRSCVTPEQVVVTNGADEAINIITLALLDLVSGVVILPPTFGEYSRAARLAGLPVIEVPLVLRPAAPCVARAAPTAAAAGVDWPGPTWSLDLASIEAGVAGGPKLIYLCSPNNPTGNRLDALSVLDLLDRVSPASWLVVDEAYWEFSGQTLLSELEGRSNLLIVRTLSKAFCVAGARIGFVLACRQAVDRLHRVRMIFNVGGLVCALGVAALSSPSYVSEVVERVQAVRGQLLDGLGLFPGVCPYPSEANFVLSRVDRPGVELQKAMERRDILIRCYPEDSVLRDHVRITVGTSEEAELCLTALSQCLAQEVGS